MADLTPADTSTLSAAPSAIPSAVASTVGTPQSIPPMDPEERAKSLNVTLADMVAKATALYQSKKYDEAAEIFSTATERQAELNGEMATENADVLFLYGRCLFKVGQSNSDVLGGKAPAEKKKKPAGADKPKPETAQPAAAATTDEGVATIAEKAGAEEEKVPESKKPLFQFTGDENFEEDDEDDEADGQGEEEEEEDDDDLAVAFEILELSRLLFEKQLHEATNEEEPKKEDAAKDDAVVADAPEENKLLRHTKERLSDIHDLLAEISLENEKFPEAIKDGRAALKYRKELYAEDSEIIAEAHYKLSLALEFASMTTAVTTEDTGEDAGPQTVDEGMRAEAAEELEKAIKSSRLKLQNKEVELATSHAPEDNEETRRQIANVKEVVAEMEQRLVDLRKPPVDVGAALGQALGGDLLPQTASTEAATKNAKDLSGLVRKKAKPTSEANAEAETNSNGSGKRKAEEDPADEQQEGAKKARVAEEPVDVAAEA
ncbi:hypothetical protein F4808DRAFT_189531 [Astrocystis sublimbata]|nr:hypothetical protein F4808DRAFT_189531 [Astrocystis sublimbata]